MKGEFSRFLYQITLKVSLLKHVRILHLEYFTITESTMCAHNDNTVAYQVLCHDQFNFLTYFGIKIILNIFYCKKTSFIVHVSLEKYWLSKLSFTTYVYIRYHHYMCINKLAFIMYPPMNFLSQYLYTELADYDCLHE